MIGRMLQKINLVTKCPVLCALSLLLSVGVLAGQAGNLAQAAELSGEQIYQERCAACHGDKGQGTESYDRPLTGDMPVADLAELISGTMPEDDPESCVGEEAEKVAAYIYDAFYSEEAQARINQPRIELARLTVRQYQNSVADLIGSFRSAGNWNDERGLRAEYFDARNFRRDRRAFDRRDATVNFQFGAASPDGEKISEEAFAIRWEGAVFAPETGDYEFLIKSENGARLWVNDRERPLIDAWVKSGDETEHRASMRLLGGRVYPLRLEFFKFKEPSASIALCWKTPHGISEVIPERHLSPNRFPEVLVIETSFPPDDRSVGYERGTSISEAWAQATTHAAIEVAAHVVAHLPELANSKDDAADREQKLREFCYKFAERAFRRPLSEEQRRFFVDQHFEGADSPETAVKRVVLLVLKSPRFLYREVGSPGFDAYDVASRLSFGLWDSLPDARLLEAAAKNELQTPEQVRAQAERMLSDLRARSKVREFFHQWLKLEHMQDLAKDAELYPGFNESLAADLRTSLELFLDEVIWSESSDFRQILLADYLYLNGRLAEFYGFELAADAGFTRVTVDPQQRAGVLSHPLLMAGFAYYSTSSPIHRGVFLARSVLGRSLRPPPEAVSPLSPDLHADLTTRERVTLQTSPASCQACHALINPLGFSLEHYDAIGRYRTEEKGKPIDASGYYRARSGEKIGFAGVRELATFLAESPEVHEAFVEQLFHHQVKQPIRAYGADQAHVLRQSFAENNFSIRRLLVEIALASALTTSEPQ